jgi:hypothetical protein
LFFEKLWVRRPPQYKADYDAVHLIESFVPRADYPVEVVGLVSLLVGAEGGASIEVLVRSMPGRGLARCGKGGVPERMRQRP